MIGSNFFLTLADQENWEEVNRSLWMNQLTIFNAVERVKSIGDIFKGVLGKRINLERTLKNMDKVYGKQERHKSLIF